MSDIPDKLRLKWLCRRGMKELDVLFERYLKNRYDVAASEERAAFARLLDHEDPQLWFWILSPAQTPEEFAAVLDHVRQYA